ncbi:PqqD family protein [Candidatus Entotheonella serta]|nr:PqqD family protein [Candidatus Entotheonella serta]
MPSHVLTRELDGESVILNLDSECYFGLDAVGTRFWTTLCESASIEAAYHTLHATYEVEAKRLRRDLEHLIDCLEQHGLVDIHLDTDLS